MWLVIAIGLLCLLIVFLASFVLLKGVKTSVDKEFAIFSYSLSFWVMANFLGANYKESSIALIATRLDFVSGCLMSFIAWRFTASLLRKAERNKGLRTFYRVETQFVVLAFTLLAALLTFIPTVIKVTKLPHAALIVTYGRLYFLFAVLLALVAIGITANLVATNHVARGRLKQQMRVMLFALVVAAVFVAFANLVLPQLSESENINLIAGNLSYLGVVFFVAATTYSIVRHRLFDLRLVLARSFAYILLVTALTAAYGALVLLLSNTIIKDYTLTASQAIVPLFAILVVAFTINPLSKYFNRQTNRLFYRDAYDPQVFIGEFNKLVVSGIELNSLLVNAQAVIEKYLKVTYCMFDIQETQYSTRRIVGGDATKIANGHELKAIYEEIKNLSSRLIVVDELEQDREQLFRYLDRKGIAVLARISTSSDHYGMLLLGAKKNGDMYTYQDLEMVRIILGELVVAIQNAQRFEEIQQFNVILEKKVEQATRRLQRANEKLVQMDETKDEFISMASHQLRTPLTSVKGYVSMVLEGDAGPINDMQRKLLDQAFISSQRMVFLIADLLNVSRLRTGKFIIEPKPVNLAEVIEGEVAQLKETAASRGLTLVFESPKPFPTLMLDETKTRQVIMNFIDNAIYYTPSGGHIIVKLAQTEKSVEFTVSDDGIGVPRHEQQHLFTKFYRAGNARKARPDGTGLGLFMARKVIVAQGGATIFKSKEGKGSMFGFVFAKSKLKVPAGGTDAVAEAKPQVVR